MDILDLSRVPEKRIFSLGEKFSGRAPDGRRIGFTNYYMTADGKPFFGISGEMHYSRVAPDQWEDSIVKMRCGGVNILSTYVFWNVHEEEDRPLVLYLTPVRTGVTVDASAMAGLSEKADTEAAELISAELVFADDVVIPEEKQRIMAHKED